MTKRDVKERLLRLGRRYYPDARLSVLLDLTWLSLLILMPYAPGKLNGWAVMDKGDGDRTALNRMLRAMKRYGQQEVLRELRRKSQPLVVGGKAEAL